MYVLQSIMTKYLGPTNHRGARVKARAAAGSVVVPWDYALDCVENHAAAARVLIRQLEWEGKWHGGALHTGAGYVFVREAHDHGQLLIVDGGK